MPDWVGRTLGRYEILAELSEDNLGSIYKANDTMLGRTVAIRVLRRSLSDGDPSLKQRLSREMENLNRLSHPHAGRTYAVEEIEGYIGLVTEHVEGRTLRDLLQSGRPLPPGQAHRIISDIAAALDEAHQQGIVHGDIRPTNIILSAEGQAILTEFGLTQQVRMPKANIRDREPTGTPAYMAPEIVHGEKPSRSSDIYALGVVLYEMLTGQPPFRGVDTTVMLAHVNQVPLPPSQVNRRLPPAIDRLMEVALAKNPADRYATAGQMVSDLVIAGTQAPARSLPSQAILLAGLILMLIVGGGLALRALLGRTPKEPSRPSLALPAGSALLGTYQVSAPKQIRPGETAVLRLIVHVPSGLSPTELPTTLPPTHQPTAESAMLGPVALCRHIWARVEAVGFDIIGPNAMRRIIQQPCAEWLWYICCQPAAEATGKGTVSIQMFVRQSGEDGAYQDIPLKDVRVEVPIAGSGFRLSYAVLGAGVAVVVLLVVVMARIRRIRNGPVAR